MKLKHRSNISATTAHDSLTRQKFIEPGEVQSALQTVNYAEMAVGETFTPHAHPDCEEYFFVIDGAAEAIINDQQIALKKGDLRVVEPNEVHAFSNNTKEVFRFLQFRILV